MVNIFARLVHLYIFGHINIYLLEYSNMPYISVCHLICSSCMYIDVSHWSCQKHTFCMFYLYVWFGHFWYVRGTFVVFKSRKYWSNPCCQQWKFAFIVLLTNLTMARRDLCFWKISTDFVLLQQGCIVDSLSSLYQIHQQRESWYVKC